MNVPNSSSVPGLAGGRIEGISFPDLVWTLRKRGATGVLTVSRGDVTKKVYVRDGQLVFASSSDPNERLGELLLREKCIRLNHLEEAISLLHQGKRLGTLLVDLGHLRPEDLVKGVIQQVRDIVLDLFAWEEGEYRFEEGPLPSDEVITLGMRTGEILFQGIRRVRSFTRIRRSVGRPRQRFALVQGWREALDGLSLGEGERLLIQRLESEPASVETLCRDLFVSNFEIYQALWTLKVLGVVREVERETRAESDASIEGRVGLQGIAPTLVLVCRTGQTGVLHVCRGSLERSFHLRDGRPVFATSNNIDDGLVAHLLRRGVISLHDREETAKRLLSNKRVGTILLEMGVLDRDDLTAMVREQVRELICDTLGWDRGEYVFTAGELPTIEEIVLESSVEDLVAEGFRRVNSWLRVRDGCGGLETPLALTPDYLSILDRMKVDPEDWEVVSSLGKARTPLEICAASTIGDFQVCRVLWTLRVLGAVREAPVERAQDDEATSALASAAPRVDERDSPPLDTTGIFTLAAEEPAAATPSAETAASIDDPAASGPANPDSEEPGIAPMATEPGGAAVTATESFPEEETAGADDDRATADPRPSGGDSPVPEDLSAAPAEVVREEVPPLDSPADATLMIPREEVEAALGIGSERGASMEFELGPPGSGLEGEAEMGARAKEETTSSLELDAPGAGCPDADETQPIRSNAEASGDRFEVDVPREAPCREAAEPRRVEEVEEHASPGGDESARSAADAATDAARVESAQAVGPADPVATTPEEPEAMSRPAATSQPSVQPAVPNDELLAELDRHIERFNRRHRLVFRAIRSEVGAGAANFVRACRTRLDGESSDLFARSRLHPDGIWEAESLRRAAAELSTSRPWLEFERMIDCELDMLRGQVGEARVNSLREQLRQV